MIRPSFFKLLQQLNIKSLRLNGVAGTGSLIITLCHIALCNVTGNGLLRIFGCC